MLGIIFIYIFTNIFYFLTPHLLYLFFLIILLFLSFRYPFAFSLSLLSMFLFSFNNNLFFWLNSFVSKNFSNIFIFPSGITSLITAILYAIFTLLLFKNKKGLRKGYLVKKIFFLCFIVLLLVFHIDHFAYNHYLFFIVLIGVIYTIIAFFSHHRFYSFPINKLTCFLCLLTILLSFTLGFFLTKKHEAKVIVWPEERGVWANTSEEYSTGDWTLKSSYSYSLLKKVMAQKYNLRNTNDLTTLNPQNEDAVFFITPTTPFSEDEFHAIDFFVKHGGKAVFLVDHTDLYGHARVANSYLQKHDINVKYDAVFAPGNPYKHNLLNDMFFTSVRPMTGCSLELEKNAHIRSFYLGFISEKADYTKPNFFGEKQWTPEDKVGVFPFWITKRYGKGTITVCTDSTIFSNFALFQPKVLSLIRGIFQWDYILAYLTDLFPYFLLALLVCLFLLCFIKSRLSLINYLLFFMLFIPTKSFIFFSSNVEAFYQNQKMLLVDSKNRYIYEPELPANYNWHLSVSNLMANLPRFGIFPYYMDFIERIYNSANIELVITNESENLSSKNTKTLVINQGENIQQSNTQKILYANLGLSDFFLGTWWTSLEISPYRKAMFKSFSNWLNDFSFDVFLYPAESVEAGFKRLYLKNENGDIKTIFFSKITCYTIKNYSYLYLGDGVWGILIDNKNKYFLLGGPSLNDQLINGFFSTNWYGIIEKEKEKEIIIFREGLPTKSCTFHKTAGFQSDQEEK